MSVTELEVSVGVRAKCPDAPPHMAVEVFVD